MTTASRINPWIIVWLCFVTLAIVLSARQSVAIMTGEWMRTLGWSKTFIGSGQSVILVVIAIVAPVTGHYADRHGVRALLAGGLLVVATGLLLFAVYPVAAVYLFGYGLIGGHALGGALGAFLGGYLFDLFARYSEMWWVAFGTAVLAGLMVYLLKENRPSRSLVPSTSAGVA